MRSFLPPVRLAAAPVIAATLLISGCATRPAATPAAVQHQLGDRPDLQLAWPQTDDARAELDRTVTALLTRDLDADTAAQIAVLNNRTLLATFEELGFSQAEVLAAGRLRNPTLFASVRWPDRSPGGPDTEFSLGADLLDATLLPLRKKIAAIELTQSERRVAHDVLQLIAEVKTAVATAQAEAELRARLAVLVDTANASADLAQRQYDSGNINHLELLVRQSTVQDARLDLARAEARFLADREALNRLLGLWGPQTSWKLAPLPPLPDDDNVPADVEAIAIAHRLDLAVARQNIALAQKACDLKRRTRWFPGSINLGIDTEHSPDGQNVTGPNIALGLPIFDQGQSELARLSAGVRQTQARYDALATDIRSEARQARDTLAAARAAALVFQQTILPQNRLLLRETLLAYNAMQKSPYELIAAKEHELNVERSSIEAVRDYWSARAELERALGVPLNAPATAHP